MAVNPNPARITSASWWFIEQLLALEPGTQNGGIYAFKAGYHNTRSNLQASAQWTSDYSIRLLADKRGPSDKAAGYDWTFPEAQRGDYRRILKYGRRVAAAFATRDPRLAGWREVLVQGDPDANPEGYDFVAWSTRTPDLTHMWHMHLSELREFTGDFDNKRRMLSVLSSPTPEEDDLATVDQGHFDALIWRVHALINNLPTVASGPTKGEKNALGAKVNEVEADVEILKARPASPPAVVDQALLKDSVREVLLEPDVMAAYAKAVNDEEARRQAS